MQSILTGLLYIDLSFHPKTPLKLVLKPGTSKLTEIPTTSTTLEMAQQKIEMVLAKLGQIDFAGLVTSLNKTANSIQALASSPALKQAIGSMGKDLEPGGYHPETGTRRHGQDARHLRTRIAPYLPDDENA